MNKDAFCHIAPTAHLDLTSNRRSYLVLAHLVEQDQDYVDFFVREKNRTNCDIIMDNSAFEMYKTGQEMYPSHKLLEMATKINANYIVMSDYPGEPSSKTINAALELANVYKDAGFGTFFVPQGCVNDVNNLMHAFRWAAEHRDLVDYVGISILSAPLAFDVEKGNKLQRFVSRLHLMYQLHEAGILDALKREEIKIHMLGMLDGPREIQYMSPFGKYIDTWDSSAAVWLGLNDEYFDNTPTGRRDGKFELEVDFNAKFDDDGLMRKALSNIAVIDSLVERYL